MIETTFRKRKKLQELWFRALLDDGAPEVRFEPGGIVFRKRRPCYQSPV
jgi:hypothetical protein